MNIAEEKILLEKCVAGDKVAWDSFVDNYSKLIYSVIYRTLDTDMAKNLIEDLYQEVFLSLLKDGYKKLKSFQWKNNCSLATWLCVVTRRLILNFIRKDSKYSSVTRSLYSRTSYEGVELIDSINSDTPSSNELLEERDMIDLLNDHLDRLSVEERTILDMFYYQELPLQDIALALGKSADAVFMQKKRTVEKLQKMIKKNVGF